MGCHFLLQRIFSTQGSNWSLLYRQADSLPLSHLGSPESLYTKWYSQHGARGRNVFLMPCPQEEYGKQQYAWWLHSHIFSFVSNTSLHSPVFLYHPETPQLRRTQWGHVPGLLNWCLSHWSRGSFLVPQGDRLGRQDTQSRPPQLTSQTLTVVTTWVALSCPTLWDPKDRSPPGFSVYGISQARILEWTAISFSRGSSRPRDGIQVSCTGRQILYHWATCAFLRYSLR